MNTYDILLTNDDGFQSPGLAAIRDALTQAGLRTLTIAPDGPRSGTSRSASFRKAIVPRLVNAGDANPVYVIDGTPVDCVRVGMISGIGASARLVLSGINEGANLGDDATYSSTLGAAVEGALLGRSALSVSQQSRDGRFRLVDLTGYDFESTATITVRLAREMLRQPPPARTVLNVNGPAKVTDHKLEITRLDRRRWDKNVFEPVATPDGPGWFTFLSYSDQDPIFEGKPGTDVAAITRGLVSISPLSFAWGEWRTQLHLHSWSRRIVSELNRATEGELAQTPQQENDTHDA